MVTFSPLDINYGLSESAFMISSSATLFACTKMSSLQFIVLFLPPLKAIIDLISLVGQLSLCNMGFVVFFMEEYAQRHRLKTLSRFS